MYAYGNLEYISDIVELKKSINRVIEEAMDKNWEVCMMRDKCFKKILDSIEASRNLAEFADWRIKECSCLLTQVSRPSSTRRRPWRSCETCSW